MKNNLLKDLAIRIKLTKLEDVRIKSDLQSIEKVILNFNYTDYIYISKEEKKSKFKKYMISEKEYRELMGLYYFAINNVRVTEREFSVALMSQFTKKYSFIRTIRMHVPNVLDKIAINGPLNIAITYLKEVQKADAIRENALKEREKERNLKGLI